MLCCIGVYATFSDSDESVDYSVPVAEALYGDIDGQVVWENDAEVATYEVLEKQVGPYETSIGTIKPTFIALAIVVRNPEDGSFIRVDVIREAGLVASNATWHFDGGINTDQVKEHVIRVSMTGQFIKYRPFRSVKSEPLTVIANFYIE